VNPSGSEYALAGSDLGVFLHSAGYGTSHSEVILTTDPINPGTTWTLTISGVTDEEANNVIVPNPTVCTFQQGAGRFCTDFSMGVPPCTTVSGTVPPHVGPEGALHLTDNGVTGNENFWTIPFPPYPNPQTFQVFNAHWQTLLNLTSSPIRRSAH